jgi:hypothetical protein
MKYLPLPAFNYGWDILCSGGDSGEAERSIRDESERHSGMNPNTIGA